MYNRPARRRAAIGFAGALARQIPATSHQGSACDFLRRHELEVQQALQSNQRERSALAGELLERAGDDRNVQQAIEHCASRGQAAGPNGLRPAALNARSRWNLASTLGELIENGEYQPSEPRTTWIDKGRGRGQRPIRIQNFEDRCVERAVLQIIRPYTESQYLDHSMGFRSPGFSRERALATAEHWALTHGQWLWISDDLRDAFEHVPTRRLAQILRQMIPNERLCRFIERIAFTRNRKGIRQGGPLSPELLNIFLHWVLDRWWRQHFPENPLLRVADDLLILARPEEAQSLYQALIQRTTAIGMPLKGSILTSLRNLTSGQSVDWLGYQVRHDSSELTVRIGQKSWDKLEDHLQLAWEAPIPALAANETIRGWISQQGACYRETEVSGVCSEISRLAGTQGFQEIPEHREVALLWSRAYDRDWLQARQDVSHQVSPGTLPAGGFASQHSVSAAVSSRGRVAIATGTTTQSTPRRREVFLYCDGSCLSPHGVGAWAYLLIDRETGCRQWNGGAVQETTNNRMELTAVIQGLAALSESSQVHLVVDSRYVDNGITQWLPTWLARGWRSADRQSRRVANVDLWEQLVEQLQRYEVDSEWIRGHAGHPENELVDRMARTIAEQFEDQPLAEP